MAFKYIFVSLMLFAACLAADTPAPSGDSTTAVAPTEKPPAPTPPKMQCAAAGFMCSDCNHQAVCIGNGDDTYLQIETECPSDSHCVENQCVKGAKCNYREFKCSAEGFFPDPYECTKYHVCVRDQQTNDLQTMNMECPSGGSYDAATASCGYPMNSTACLEGPVPLCVSPLQIGMLKSDPSIYYLCTESGESMGPELFKCAGGRIFDTKKVSCVAAKKTKK
ncbi:hypothetical protein O3M35_012475 [Rhynocoris fuscipes]|uniref:Chitin-binding type-2 domain-containing protein n=1 Tax=Rhynocoris fuscipes TaxID=488301 RepID=A0AAW1CV01_9HEMI